MTSDHIVYMVLCGDRSPLYKVFYTDCTRSATPKTTCTSGASIRSMNVSCVTILPTQAGRCVFTITLSLSSGMPSLVHSIYMQQSPSEVSPVCLHVKQQAACLTPLLFHIAMTHCAGQLSSTYIAFLCVRHAHAADSESLSTAAMGHACRI